MIDGQVRPVLDELREMSYDERVAKPCIGAGAPICAGPRLRILEAIRRVFPCTRLRVADPPARGHVDGDDARRHGGTRHYGRRS